MSVAVPDIAGFIAAQKTFRKTFGDMITFSIPQDATWPAGTTINPDTGAPYSAMVVRTNPQFTTVAIVAGVILKEASPLRPQADVVWSEVGLMSGMDIILDVDADDYATVQPASEFAYATKNYKLEEWKPFAMADVTYRWLAYGKER